MNLHYFDFMNIGEKFILHRIVADNETAEVLGSGGLPVYATPSMICHMELAAYSLAVKYGNATVGTRVEINHLRACRVGTAITVTAELTEVDGRRLEFNVSAEDGQGLLGEGKHQRYIIDPERFMNKLN